MNFIVRPTAALAAASSRASDRPNSRTPPLILRAAGRFVPDLANGLGSTPRA